MNDEFYKKFPSYNENSKENKRNRKLLIDFNTFLKTRNESISDKNVRRAKFPSSTNQQFDVFSVEERNNRVASESREKKLNYQKILLQQIEEAKLKKKIYKEREIETEKILEKRLQKQIENMSLHQKNDPLYSRPVERISFSENDKYQPRCTNNVYRYFSKSSNTLFNYNDVGLANLDRLSDNEQFIAKDEFTCKHCKKRIDFNEDIKYSRKSLRTNMQDKSLNNKFIVNYPPYTFDNSKRYQKNSLRDVNKYDYSKLFNEFKNLKLSSTKENLDIKKGSEANIEDLLGSNHHQRYTVITGFAKSFLEKA